MESSLSEELSICCLNELLCNSTPSMTKMFRCVCVCVEEARDWSEFNRQSVWEQEEEVSRRLWAAPKRPKKGDLFSTEVANVCVCVCVGVLITNCYDDKSPSRNDMRINKHLRVAAHRLRKFFVDGCYAQLLLNILTGTSPLPGFHPEIFVWGGQN